MKAKEISQAIGSIFLLINEASRSYKIELICKLTKSEVRNINY